MGQNNNFNLIIATVPSWKCLPKWWSFSFLIFKKNPGQWQTIMIIDIKWLFNFANFVHSVFFMVHLKKTIPVPCQMLLFSSPDYLLTTIPVSFFILMGSFLFHFIRLEMNRKCRQLVGGFFIGQPIANSSFNVFPRLTLMIYDSFTGFDQIVSVVVVVPTISFSKSFLRSLHFTPFWIILPMLMIIRLKMAFFYIV